MCPHTSEGNCNMLLQTCGIYLTRLHPTHLPKDTPEHDHERPQKYVNNIFWYQIQPILTTGYVCYHTVLWDNRSTQQL